MDTKSLQVENVKSVYHPSMFEQQPKEVTDVKRTLLSIRQERDQRLSEKDFKDIVSRGSFHFTDDDKKISKNNTKSVFKNIYGDTPLTFLFFSDKNVDNIQKLLRLRTYQESGYVIDDQSVNELLTIMRSVFLEHSAHPPLIHENMTKDTIENLLVKYTNEVNRLNMLVVEFIIPKLISQVKQYFGYLKDASAQPQPLPPPISESTTGTKAYKSVTQVLIGGNF